MMVQKKIQKTLKKKLEARDPVLKFDRTGPEIDCVPQSYFDEICKPHPKIKIL